MFAKRALGLAAALMLFTAACGDDDDDASVGAGNQNETQADTERSETYDEDLAVAEAAVLTLNDLPVGWSSQPRDDDDSDDEELDQQVADCLDVPVEEIAESTNPKAESETFVSDDDTEIEAEVIVAPTVDEAVEDFEQVTSPQFLNCLRDILPAFMEDAAEEAGGDLAIVDANVGPLRIEQSGDRSAAYRLTLAVQAEGFNVDVYVDLLMAQVGRATMQVTTTSVFTAPDLAFTQSLLDVMVDRIDGDAVS